MAIATSKTTFACPNCDTIYQLIKVEAGPGTVIRQQITCRQCGAPFNGREGKFVLKYRTLIRPDRRSKSPRGRGDS
jgi:hypothetical protein